MARKAATSKLSAHCHRLFIYETEEGALVRITKFKRGRQKHCL
jgi:hypothetical protein